jgi:hypothetical protein
MTRSLSFGPRPLLYLLAGISIAVVIVVPVCAQSPLSPELFPGFNSAIKKKEQAHPPAEKGIVQPSVVIPVAPLGFAPPASFYLGDRFAQVSLNFLDEDNLLFTFRVPGLIVREHHAPGQSPEAERHIRALTLSLPSGKVTAESLWVQHDYQRYLWMLKDSKFLLRDKNIVQIGDASLHLEPFLRFPGTVNFIQIDPGQHLLVADTTEPWSPEHKPASEKGVQSGVVGQPSAAAANISVAAHTDPVGDAQDQQASHPESQNLLRVLSLDTRKVMLLSRVSAAVLLPIDGEGYYEALRGNGTTWTIDYEYFQGASNLLGGIESTCRPNLDAISPGIVLATACTTSGTRRITALSRNCEKDHCRLWDVTLPPTKVWPLLTSSSDGLRIARATLEVNHPVSTYSPVDSDDIRGQSVQIYDLATGKLQLTAPASPVLDGGGNFALSPSGRRFAVLNAGSIQVYDLPPAPPIPDPHPAKP